MVHKSKKLIDLTAVKNQWIKELTAVCNHRIGRDEVLALRNDFLTTKNASNGRCYFKPIFAK